MLSTPKGKAELFLASSLYDGLEDNNIMQVTTLLLNKEADPNVLIPSQGITPFHLVIGNDSETFAEEVTKLFLRHGGNPNVKSTDGMTPVHVAAAWGRLGVLDLLLSNGGDPLLVDDEGRSPFHYAFDEAHYDAVATLGKYCGEPFEEDSDLKYNIALDKVLVSNGGIVAEYAVSNDSLSSSADNFATIHRSKNSNNNDLLENLNRPFLPSTKIENHVREWRPKNPRDNDVTITSTADETSASLSKFVEVRRHRRCLPRKNLKHVERNLGNREIIKLAEPDVPKENLQPRNAGIENQPPTSPLDNEVSFHVEARKNGENMPRISSPKAKEKVAKSEIHAEVQCRNIGSTKATIQDNNGKNKLVCKTPLISSSKKIPMATIKKTPTDPLALKKGNNLNRRITPNGGKFQPHINKAVIRTPNKYIGKKSSFSPDCSIVSKSPNLMGKARTPINDYKLKEERKVAVDSRGTSSAKNFKTKVAYGSNYKTPPPDKICNKVNSGKHFSRFVKQSELRHEGIKKTPTSSPSKFRNSPTWSNKVKRTPNLTDSTKRKRIVSTVDTKTALTPLYSKIRSPLTPLNKTYKKDRWFDAAGLSPDVETNNRFVDRRTLDKKIAIKLEETMYDDNFEKGISSADFEVIKKIPPIITPLKTNIKTVVDSKYPELDERRVSNVTDNPLTSDEYVEISGVHKLPDSARVSVESSQSYDNARGSKVIAGFFRQCDIDGSSARTSNTNSVMNNAIVSLSGISSNISPSNLVTTENPLPAAYPKHPDSKEIDDSLVSSDPSSCAGDPTNSLNFGDTGLSIKSDELSSKMVSSRFIGERYSTNFGGTCSAFPNVSSITESSNYMSFVSVEEEYKYEDAEEGVVLLERRLLTTPVSIPMIKAEEGIASSEKSSQSFTDESRESRVSSLPHSLVIMDSDTLRRELTKLDSRPPGPITTTTRHVYLKRLRKLQKHGPAAPSSLPIAVPSKFSTEIERTLRSESWMNDLTTYEALEQQVFSEFANPDPTRRWREGTIKSSFNYLLMDPRVTDNLPRRAEKLSSSERWQTFLSSIFYVGKGRRSRPYAHLYEAYGDWKKGVKDSSDKKVNHILDIWKSDCGVVCLHLFQNTIPAEAYTREAAMIEALGLDKLKNLKSGDYYGVASTWSNHQKRTLGVYLLYKAMHILINEGERQLSPDDIGR